MKTLFLALSALIATPALAHQPTDREILAPGHYEWADEVEVGAPIHILVNLNTQMAYIYQGSEVIGAASVSSGREGYDTPVGDFTILGKEVLHHSKHYDADMPYTQWITNDGVALHAGGSGGGNPSSHGCIHLPKAFAEELFQLTQVGDEVVVVNEMPEIAGL